MSTPSSILDITELRKDAELYAFAKAPDSFSMAELPAAAARKGVSVDEYITRLKTLSDVLAKEKRRKEAKKPHNLVLDLADNYGKYGPKERADYAAQVVEKKLFVGTAEQFLAAVEEVMKERRDEDAALAAEKQGLDDWLSPGSTITFCDAEVLRRSSLFSVLDFESRRKQAIKKADMRATVFDQQLNKLRPKHDSTEPAYSTATVGDIRVYVQELLDEDKPSEGDRKNAEYAIWAYLRKHAKIFCCYKIGHLLLNDGDGVPIEVSQDDENFNKLLISFGIHPGSPSRIRVGRYITTGCYHEGVHCETRLGFHYDSEKFTAYVALDRGKLIKVTAQGFSQVANGVDGNLFVFPPAWEPLLSKDLNAVESEIGTTGEITRSLVPDDFLLRYLFQDVHFDIRGLEEAQIRILLMAYLLFLMLPGAVSERVLLECLGPSGSGKTFFAVIFGLILSGPNFKAQSLPTEPREYDNQVINAYYLVYDNVGFVSRAIRDRICQSVTGMDVVRRILYSDKEELRVPSKATIAISAIVSPLGELEHSNRSITTNFTERPKGTYISEKELRKQIQANRDAIILNLLRRMVLVIKALEAERDFIPKVNNRLASVATFILRIAKHEGWEEEASKLLDVWASDQISESLADDDVSEAIAKWMRSGFYSRGEWLTATRLNEELIAVLIHGDSCDDSKAKGKAADKAKAKQEDPISLEWRRQAEALRMHLVKNLSWESNVLKLAKKINANFAIYAARFGLKKRKSQFRNSRGTWAYCFEPSREQREAAFELADGRLAAAQMNLPGSKRQPTGKPEPRSSREPEATEEETDAMYAALPPHFQYMNEAYLAKKAAVGFKGMNDAYLAREAAEKSEASPEPEASGKWEPGHEITEQDLADHGIT
jgi:hypothetical protein